MRAEDLPLWERTLIAAYRWRRVNPIPSARLARPLEASRVALVTTAGLVSPGDKGFDLARRGGDTGFRVIPAGIGVAALTMMHRSHAFDRDAVARDANVALPLEPLAALAADRLVGAAAPRHLSFMGSITAPGRLRKEDAPAAAALLVEDNVDIALLAPV